ncbi:GAF domain-containing SpoIIE family protein phosphatase [Streptomyces sp. NPDC087908]|uniref:GAF domain-containing SpoIIE family protein phosphatase n=1 Tax=unclassified Streptomyces TaxID=2593676 RepID=UPI0011CE9DBD|nr:GAF domain-containing SpoIIE family protein phosphatase [Streptomyces sp. adm13(2018)]TXS32493.1 GAF domain-containing protein [Streptomyces sp. adm13(2018)]
MHSDNDGPTSGAEDGVEGSPAFPERGGPEAAADEGMDRFARVVSAVLDVPAAVVALACKEWQFLPGVVGLEEWSSSVRQADLTGSPCAYVVASGEPLVVRDARTDARVRDFAPAAWFGAVACAAVPLTDEAGTVLGALCALDFVPRSWGERDVEVLENLAQACSTQLRLQASARQAQQAGTQAATLLGNSRLLLRAAETMAHTSGLEQVRRQVSDLVSGDLRPAYVGLVLRQESVLRRVPDRMASYVSLEERFPVYDPQERWPSAQAARENRIVLIPDRQTLVEQYHPDTVVEFDAMNLRSAVCVPLPGTYGRALGTLILAWHVPRTIDIAERAVLTVLARYTADAVERALFLDGRIDVARQLQRAMLTDLPTVQGLQLAALYRTAADQDMVGGDWYDAHHLNSSRTDATTRLALTVGDITGHNMQAATLMGQARSMLRQASHDHSHSGPAAAVDALYAAATDLGMNISGTLVHAHLTSTGDGAWDFTWTNAGHPPPLLDLPGHPVRQLHEHDLMLYPGLPAHRTQHRVRLEPGATLLLYTDGLVEEPGTPIDQKIEQVSLLLADNSSTPVQGLLQQIAERVAGPAHHDDIALLAVRVDVVKTPRTEPSSDGGL